MTLQKKKRPGRSSENNIIPFKPNDNLRPQAAPAPPAPVRIKMTFFRCADPSCEGHKHIRDDIPESQAKGFTYCMDCGKETMQRVSIYECRACARQSIVPFGEKKPASCSCGCVKLTLKE